MSTGDYDDVWYSSADGLRLYARDYACSDAGITHPRAVLCMHGLTRNSADFHDLALHLRERCRVIGERRHSDQVIPVYRDYRRESFY